MSVQSAQQDLFWIQILENVKLVFRDLDSAQNVLILDALDVSKAQVLIMMDLFAVSTDFLTAL